MKRLIISFLFLILMTGIVEAPCLPYYYIKVRLTCYSVKQPKEGNRTSLNKCAKNERGVAVPKGFLSYGTKIILPDGDERKVDDRIPNKSARKFNYKVVDIRFYETITARPKTKLVNKQLRKLDMGWDYIKVYMQE